ncbi:MAG: hypothetical protein RLZZ584_3973 [Pseudomonadota bacterium]|jgi:uncharacterized protein (DUF2132 family)
MPSPLRPDAPPDNDTAGIRPAGATPAATAPPPPAQPRNPLHGVTLQAMLEALVEHFGWHELGVQVPLRCFTHDPSISSSLKLLRRTPWAREKVESLYLYMLREQRRDTNAAASRARRDA